jgi:hypothetical protein
MSKGERRGRTRSAAHAEQVRLWCAAPRARGAARRPGPGAGPQVTRQLEAEKAALLERKRQEQAERRRKQEELDRILVENRRKARPRPPAPVSAGLAAILQAGVLGAGLQGVWRGVMQNAIVVKGSLWPSCVGYHTVRQRERVRAWRTRALTARRSAGGGGAGAGGGGPAAARGAAVRARPAALGLAWRPHARARELQILHVLLQHGRQCPVRECYHRSPSPLLREAPLLPCQAWQCGAQVRGRAGDTEEACDGARPACKLLCLCQGLEEVRKRLASTDLDVPSCDALAVC